METAVRLAVMNNYVVESAIKSDEDGFSPLKSNEMNKRPKEL